TKALLHVAAEVRNGRHAGEIGVRFGEPELDLEAIDGFKSSVVKKMTGGVGMLFKGNKVEVLKGEARFVSKDEVEVAGERHKAKKFIVATGSRPASIPGFEIDGDGIIDSTGALEVGGAVPGRMLVIGGGAIGLEFADVYQALGSQVTVVELLEQIAPASDADAAKELRK